jgi:hypothetical protein
VRLDDPLIRRIRELSRAEEDLQHEQVRAGHQLRELLNRSYPEMLQLCPGVDEPWFGDAIELFPLPGSKLSQPKMERLLRSYRIRRLDADAVRQALGVRALKLAPGAAEAASEQALLILPMLRLFLRQRKERERRIEVLLDEMSTEGQLAEHRDVTSLRGLPGVGRASPPRGSRRLRKLSQIEMITRCAATAGPRPLRIKAESAGVSSCGRAVIKDFAMRFTTGRESVHSATSAAENMTRSCAPKVIPTVGHFGQWQTGCSEC